MPLSAAKRLFIANLAGGHLDQRRAGKKDLRLLLYHNYVIGHSRQVSAAGCRAAKDYGDGGNALFGAARDFAKPAASGDKNFALLRQISPGGFHQKNAGQMVL